MQTCSLCNAQSPDTATQCVECGADLSEYSASNVALKKFIANPRVRDIRLVVSNDACPVCTAHAGTYTKDSVPRLPIEGCSNPTGCNCFYEPMLIEIYP